MDIQKEYMCLEQNSKVLCKNVDVDFDFQETLPAYVDDVYRVVKCCARSYVTSADISFNEIKIYGKVNIGITYYNENSGLCYADFEEDFSRSITAENLSDNAFVYADICDKYTSFRVINQRRIDIHLSSVIHIDIYDKVKCPCLKNCENSKLKISTIKAADIVASNISRLEFDEEFGVPSDAENIQRIVSYSSNAYLNDVRVIKDKALIKADVKVEVLYTYDDSDNLLKSEYEFTVSKILEISGISDEDIVIANVGTGNMFLRAKNLSGDKLDTINVYGDVTADTVVIREKNIDIITDAYILNRNSDTTLTDITVLADGKVINDKRQVNISFKLPYEITEIKELSLNIASYSFKDGKITAQARCSAVMINSSNELTSVFTDGEFEIQLESFEKIIASLSIKSFDYSFKSNDSIDVRATVDVMAYAYNDKTYKIISDIDADDSIIDYPSITVYFGKENDSVWDIAKAFSSDTSMIIKENSLPSDILDSNKVLIIPKG